MANNLKTITSYGIALKYGYKGTKKDWYDYIKRVSGGTTGATGKDGLSAYEVAVNNGFTGTEEEWLESLKGEDGANIISGSSYSFKINDKGELILMVEDDNSETNGG